MRFTYAEAMTSAHYYAPLARAAEAAGYTSMTVADSLVYPRESDSTYPYTDTGDREFLADKEFIETMVLVTHLAAVTSTLRFTPFVLKLPVRPPVLVAKQVSSIAYLSNNRLGLGVGLSPTTSPTTDSPRNRSAPRSPDLDSPRRSRRPHAGSVTETPRTIRACAGSTRAG